MKSDIHPTYNEKIAVACACGNKFTTGSTLEAITVEVCSNCHPFYTGKQKLVDTAKRVDKFEARQAKAESLAKTRKGRKSKRAEQNAKKSTVAEKTAQTARSATKKPAAMKTSGQ